MPDELSQEERDAIVEAIRTDKHTAPLDLGPEIRAKWSEHYLMGVQVGWLACRTRMREQEVENPRPRCSCGHPKDEHYQVAIVGSYCPHCVCGERPPTREAVPEAKSHDYPLEGFDIWCEDGEFRVSYPHPVRVGKRLHVVPASKLAAVEREVQRLKAGEAKRLRERAEKAEARIVDLDQMLRASEEHTQHHEGEVKQLREENAKLERVWEMDQQHGTELLKSRRHAWEDLEKAEARVQELEERLLQARFDADVPLAELRKDYERSQARVQELERIVVDALPQLKTIAAALKPADTQPADPDPAQFRENAEKEIKRLRDRLRSAEDEIHRRKRDQDLVSKVVSETMGRALAAESSVRDYRRIFSRLRAAALNLNHSGEKLGEIEGVSLRFRDDAWPSFIDALRDAQQFADIGELREAVEQPLEVRPKT